MSGFAKPDGNEFDSPNIHAKKQCNTQEKSDDQSTKDVETCVSRIQFTAPVACIWCVYYIKSCRHV